MAVEKLTKGRLIQIIVTFSVLIIAFTWRTFNHDSSLKLSDLTCGIQNVCWISLNNNEYQLGLDVKLKKFRVLAVENRENDTVIEFNGEHYQISEFIAVENANSFSFIIKNGQQSIRVNVNKA
ncbi:hypothetical protein [Vibrio ezurae]|uniref:Uncharacterized protein n=1 Tax=Vibrio ezurae NBRC 102218 TaxID=1219080 RepID=U3AI08_9VIBR|nr:hypothetical protein [Vibrio ezurae]GAD79571.1 hypothetical protein VEZ01S_17_00580 [Vibrio ezurae NBRC 102218]